MICQQCNNNFIPSGGSTCPRCGKAAYSTAGPPATPDANARRPEDFGPAGQGNDDAPYIQAAIDALNANYSGGTGGGRVLFRDGKQYKVNSPVVLKTGVRLEGEGNRRTPVIYGNYAGPIITSPSDGTGNPLAIYIALENLFIYNLSAAAAARSIQFEQVSVLDLDRLTCQGIGTYNAQIHLCYNVTVDRSRFGGASGADAALFCDGTGVAGQAVTALKITRTSFTDSKAGLLLHSCRGIEVAGCHFENLAGGATTYNGGVTGTNVWGGVVEGNYFETLQCPSIQFYNSVAPCRGLVVGGNYVTNTIHPMMAASNCEKSTFLSNYFIPGSVAINASGLVGNANTVKCHFGEQYLASGTGQPLDLSSSPDYGSRVDNGQVRGRNSLILMGKAGVVADTDFSITPPDDTIAWDRTNKKIGVRVGGSWVWTTALA